MVLVVLQCAGDIITRSKTSRFSAVQKGLTKCLKGKASPSAEGDLKERVGGKPKAFPFWCSGLAVWINAFSPCCVILRWLWMSHGNYLDFSWQEKTEVSISISQLNATGRALPLAEPRGSQPAGGTCCLLSNYNPSDFPCSLSLLSFIDTVTLINP